MKKIILDDDFYLNFIKMNPLVHSESDIYHNYELAYKIYVHKEYKFDDFLKCIRKKQKKIELLSQITDMSDSIIPKDLLVWGPNRDNMFAGYSMEYLDHSETLFEIYFKLNYLEFLKLIINVSISLKKIHRRSEGIVLGDLNFCNVLVKMIDGIYRYYFIDFDNATIGKIPSERISPLASDYIVYRGTKFKIDRNFDRLTFLLHFFDLVFGKEIYKISMYEYDKQAERMAVLRRLRNIVLELRKPEGKLPSVPYFHEVACVPIRSVKKR